MWIKSIPKATLRAAYRSIKSTDRFPKHISFTYRGKESFKTLIGGIATISILILITIYGLALMRVMWYKKDTNKSRSSTVVSLNSNSETHYPGTNYALII